MSKYRFVVPPVKVYPLCQDTCNSFSFFFKLLTKNQDKFIKEEASSKLLQLLLYITRNHCMHVIIIINE